MRWVGGINDTEKKITLRFYEELSDLLPEKYRKVSFEYKFAGSPSRFHLEKKIKPFTRCLLCNNLLESVDKNKIRHRLEDNTRKYYSEFYICKTCDKIYWKGSHYERMNTLIEKLKGELIGWYPPEAIGIFSK
ncbi:MAG: Mut7-C RNAse domain-containing protein [Spirochaetia bacterium]|nr:Mut7-C RNAse domain-containing protein [Spirochaetia bacterium]